MRWRRCVAWSRERALRDQIPGRWIGLVGSDEATIHVNPVALRPRAWASSGTRDTSQRGVDVRRTFNLIAAVVLVLAACSDGGGDSAVATTLGDGGPQGASTGASVVNVQPPGQAMVLVDGQEFTLTEPGALECSITQDAITISFRIGDNEVTLGGGANLYDAEWLGSADLRVANPAGEPGPISYFPDLAAHGDGISIDGDSMSYVGPMQKRPANDGTNPPPVDVGEGTISATCA